MYCCQQSAQVLVYGSQTVCSGMWLHPLANCGRSQNVLVACMVHNTCPTHPWISLAAGGGTATAAAAAAQQPVHQASSGSSSSSPAHVGGGSQHRLEAEVAELSRLVLKQQNQLGDLQQQVAELQAAVCKLDGSAPWCKKR